MKAYKPVRSKENFLTFGAPPIEEPEIAEVLGKSVEVRELRSRGETYRAALRTLWSEEAGIFLNKNLDTGAFRGAQAQWDRITVPFYSAGNWTGFGLHLRVVGVDVNVLRLDLDSAAIGHGIGGVQQVLCARQQFEVGNGGRDENLAQTRDSLLNEIGKGNGGGRNSEKRVEIRSP